LSVGGKGLDLEGAEEEYVCQDSTKGRNDADVRNRT